MFKEVVKVRPFVFILNWSTKMSKQRMKPSGKVSFKNAAKNTTRVKRISVAVKSVTAQDIAGLN